MSDEAVANYLLDETVTAGYEPGTQFVGVSYFTAMARYPAFNLAVVREMLVDPRIRFGFELLWGPILTKGRYSVTADNPAISEFVTQMMDRYLNVGIKLALKSLYYGYSVNEVKYELRNGLVQLKEFKYLRPADCRPLCYLSNGEFAAAAVRMERGNNRIILGGPKVLWTTHEPNEHPWYGISRLYHAYLPWIEKWHDGGFRDCRRLYFYKYAYDGGIMRHPAGSTNVYEDPTTGQAYSKPNHELARNMVDNLRTGGTVFMPNAQDAKGNYLWQWERGQIGQVPSGLLDYGKDLDNEIWQGMGIPTEVAEAPGGSSGAYGGRSVPMDAFACIVHSVFVDMSLAFIKQIVHPLVILNFGRENSYVDIRPHGILVDNEEAEASLQGKQEADAGPGGPSLEDKEDEQDEESVNMGKVEKGSKKPVAMSQFDGEAVVGRYLRSAEGKRNLTVTVGGNYRYGE